MISALAKSIEQLAIDSLEARCCDKPRLCIVFRAHIFKKYEEIICQNCLSTLEVKQETFLSPKRK
jgi:hypothetical protein